MRRVVVAPVRDNGNEVCHLKRNYQVFTFANSDRVYVGEFPWPAAISTIIVRRTGNQASLLIREVNPKWLAKSETLYVLFPLGKSYSCVLIRIVRNPLVEHSSKRLPKVRVA